MDVYVLPSSQHELILVPVTDSYDYDPKELLEMVKEVNRTQVEAEDYLADHVYLLDGRTKVLNIVA